MPANDEFTPDHPLPLFLSHQADRPEARGSSPILKASILLIAATVIGGAIAIWLGNPVKVPADVTASLTKISGLRPGTDQPSPIVQSPPEAQASPPTARGVASANEIPASFDTPDRNQNETAEAPSGALLKQFQAWSAEQDARAHIEPEQPAQDARAQASQDAPASVRHRKVRTVQNVRADTRPPRDPHARVRRDQHARVQVRPVQDARAQDQSQQNTQAPSLVQSLGWWRQ
jgi:hypothetical protein